MLTKITKISAALLEARKCSGMHTISCKILEILQHAYMYTYIKVLSYISSRRKLNSLTLSRHTQLLEILEIPQVSYSNYCHVFVVFLLVMAHHQRTVKV